MNLWRWICLRFLEIGSILCTDYEIICYFIDIISKYISRTLIKILRLRITKNIQMDILKGRNNQEYQYVLLRNK